MILSLDEVSRYSEAEVGYKAWNLSKVHAAGIRVPRTLVIHSSVVNELLSKEGIRHEIFRISRAIRDSEDGSEVLRLSEQLRSKIHKLDIPEDFLEDLLGRLKSEIGKDLVILRPSPYSLELQDGDLKGRTQIWFTDLYLGGLARAIKTVIAGVFSPRAIARVMDLGAFPEDLSVGIIVQEAILPKSSGIATCCPARRVNEIVIESMWGLFSWDKPKDEFRILLPLMEVQESEIQEKRTMLVPTSHGIREIEVPDDRWVVPSLSTDEIGEISGIASDLSLILGTPSLIEWILDEEGTFYVIQAHKESERPPIKPLEEKVIEWLSRPVEEKIEEIPGGEEKVEPTEVIAEVSHAPLVSARVYSPPGLGLAYPLVDGYVLSEPAKAEEFRGTEVLFYLRRLEDAGKLPIEEGTGLVIGEEMEDEALDIIGSLIGDVSILKRVSRAASILRSLEEVLYDGLVIDMGSLVEEVGEAGALELVRLIVPYFSRILVELGERRWSIDTIVEILDLGVEGFVIGSRDHLYALARAELILMKERLEGSSVEGRWSRDRTR